MDKPDVTVVMPIFNRHELAVKAAESLLAQDTFFTYEIVVVDDGSTDGVAEAVLKLDKKIRAIRLTRNQGAAVARHVGIQHARADVVVFHDSDDIAMPTKLSALVDGLTSNQKAVLAYGQVDDEMGKRLNTNARVVDQHETCELMIRDPFLTLLSHKGPIVAAMNLATYRDIGLASSRGRGFYRAANDYDLQLRIARSGQFVHVPVVTHTRISSPQGISGKYGLVRQLAYALHAADDAFRRSARRREQQTCEVMRERVRRDWPRAVLGAAFYADWNLLRAVLPIGPRYLNWSEMPGGVKRALRWVARRQPELMPNFVVRRVLDERQPCHDLEERAEEEGSNSLEAMVTHVSVERAAAVDSMDTDIA